MGGLLVGVGATVGTLAYAKANPEFRKQVEGNWPMLLDVFPYFLDEDAAGDTKKSKADSMSLGGGKKPLIPIRYVSVKAKVTGSSVNLFLSAFHLYFIF